MSSKPRRISKKLSEEKKYAYYEAYNTLIGSIILSCAKLAGIPEHTAIAEFHYVKNNLNEFRPQWTCAKDIADHYVKKYHVPEEYKQYLTLAIDDENSFTPLCTILYEENLLPIASDGSLNGILLAIANAQTENQQKRFRIEMFYEPETDQTE